MTPTPTTELADQLESELNSRFGEILDMHTEGASREICLTLLTATFIALVTEYIVIPKQGETK